MPIIFLREQGSDLRTLEPKREVVDGQQRIRTLVSYIDSSLLSNYTPARDFFTIKKNHNADIAGKVFKELPPKVQQRILDYQFSVHVLPADVDDREVLQIFARMNATGVKLNEQELRNAEYFGECKTSMYELASEQLPRWRNWMVYTEYNIARMEEVELVSEFAVMMVRGISARNQGLLNKFYLDYDVKFVERGEVERRFRAVMDAIEDSFASHIKNSAFRRKTLFYSLFAAVYDSLFGIQASLKPKKAKSLTNAEVTWVKKAGAKILDGSAPQPVLDAAAKQTTNVSSRKTIVSYLSNK